MNVKKIVGTVLSVGGPIVAGVLLKKGLSKETVNVVTKAVTETEKTFGGIPLSKLNEIAKSVDSRDYCTIGDFWCCIISQIGVVKTFRLS